MEPKDLMIDIFVYFNCFDGTRITVKVTGFNGGIVYGVSKNCSHWCTIEKVEPIPLTSEILEKNGFIKKEHRWILLDSYTKDKLIVLLNAANCFALLTTEGMTLAFQYVHELQHFYRLCGINKEIEL